MSEKLFLIFLCFQIFAMNQDLYMMDMIDFAEKYKNENFAHLKNQNKGEFYRAQKEEKIIYFLGTMHAIGCSKYANNILVKVRKTLEQDQVSKIDKLWTESEDYKIPKHPDLDGYYFEGLKGIAKQTGSLDEYSEKYLQLQKIVNFAKEESLEQGAERCQSFMRGYPPQTWFAQWILEQSEEDLRLVFSERNKQWVQKLLNGKEIQIVVTGAGHNWFKTGVLNLLDEKAWKITQIDLNLEEITVTSKMVEFWLERKQMHIEQASRGRKIIISMRLIREMARNSPLIFLAALINNGAKFVYFGLFCYALITALGSAF